jgi:hypothetical protein
MIRVTKVGAWSQVGRLLAGAPRRVHAAVDKAVLQEAQFLRTKIVEGIREQAPGGRAFAPLAPTTLAIRRFRGFAGTKTLIVQGDLRNAVTVVKDGDRAFVGVLRTAQSRSGQSLADIAALQEHGSKPIVTTLTPKARAFLHAAFRRAGLDSSTDHHASTNIAVLQIPPRPFLSPVFDTYAQPAEVAKRFLERVSAHLQRDFGRP